MLASLSCSLKESVLLYSYVLEARHFGDAVTKDRHILPMLSSDLVLHLVPSKRSIEGRWAGQYSSLGAPSTLRSSSLPPLNKSPLLGSLVFYSELRKRNGTPLAGDDLVTMDGPAP